MVTNWATTAPWWLVVLQPLNSSPSRDTFTSALARECFCSNGVSCFLIGSVLIWYFREEEIVMVERCILLTSILRPHLLMTAAANEAPPR